MIFLLLGGLAIMATLYLTPNGRRLRKRLNARRLGLPAAVVALGLLLTIKGEPITGGAFVLLGVIWAGRATRVKPAIPDSAPKIAEARALLGLTHQADRATIIAAHRSLIARNHPDIGGSEEIARRINAARDLLLEHLLT